MTRFFDQLGRDLVEAARREQRATGRARNRARGAASSNAARVALAGAAAALVLVIASPFGGGEGDREATARLEGTYTSAYTTGARYGRERGLRAGSTLEIAGGRFTLLTDDFGLQGEIDIDGGTARLRSDTPYFRRPNFSTGGRPLPDPEGGCRNADGRYTFARRGATLRFTLVRDPCRPRAAQLTARAWTVRD